MENVVRVVDLFYLIYIYMYTHVFQITNFDSYPIWCENEDGSRAPMRNLMLKDVTEDPIMDEVMCPVYGIDAIKKYELGEYVLATLDCFVGYDDDGETRKQVIRVIGISKVILPHDS
jgi:hypothetical protein